MHIEQVSNLEAIAFFAGVIGLFYLIYRLIPAGDKPPATPQRHFSLEVIYAYDREIPKYFLVAALALILGGLHTVIKNIPGFYQWLWEAGYGGHLFRDLSNSHIIIVGGGTILLTGLTWYLLPRFTNRPLFSTGLASASFWLTTVGLYGFYISWVVLGLVEGNMVRGGWDYLIAKQALGDAHTLPTAISASIMGMGYWTYVANTFLTVLSAIKFKNKPFSYLLKFSIISATGLFIGTVQGVIQVLPVQADWIRLAGQFGEYIDPISHAHVNLVTGVMISLVAFLAYYSVQLGGKPISKSTANRIFWVLAPGSLAFYLSFLFLGLILGGAANGYGGIQNPAIVPFVQKARPFILAFAGTWMLVGFWMYFITLWRSLGLRSLGAEIRKGSPKAFWLVSSLALMVGTFQGMLQVIPETARIIDLPSELPNIHAQLNMIGGVLLALMGLVYLMLPRLLGKPADQKLARYSLYGVAGGIFGYYTVTVIAGFVRYGYLHQGLTDAQTATHLSWVLPALMVVTSLPMFLGYLSFGTALWRATGEYRDAWAVSIQKFPLQYNNLRWQNRYPIFYYLMGEFFAAMAGFPGLGWVLSGRAFPGVPMLLGGPMFAWAVIPMLEDPYGTGFLRPFGPISILVYLVMTTILSEIALIIALRRNKKGARKEEVSVT